MACLIRPFIRRATAPIPQTRKEGKKEGFCCGYTTRYPSPPPHGFVFSRIVNLVAIVRNWQRVSITIIISRGNVVELESRRKVCPRVKNQARNFLRGVIINFFLLKIARMIWKIVNRERIFFFKFFINLRILRMFSNGGIVFNREINKSITRLR